MAFEVLEATLPAQAAAGATSVTEVGVIPSTESETNWGLQKLSLAAPSLVTGVATNNVTFNIRAVTGGTPAVVGTLTLGAGVNLAAEAEVNVPISAAAVAAGAVLDVQMVQNGTGLAVPAGVLVKAEIA